MAEGNVVKLYQMKMQTILFLLTIIFFNSYHEKKEKKDHGVIEINWIAELKGDFSFKETWSYNEGIYKNEHGQLSCDGLCPAEIYSMQDNDGKIYKDSLSAFYKLVDTTHQFYSIKSEVIGPEYFNTNFIKVKKINKDTIIGYTETNAAAHTKLSIKIVDNICIPVIELNSIRSAIGSKKYPCKSGKIFIDKNLWTQGIIKAEFNFTFAENENSKDDLLWKGKIYSIIKL